MNRHFSGRPWRIDDGAFVAHLCHATGHEHWHGVLLGACPSWEYLMSRKLVFRFWPIFVLVWVGSVVVLLTSAVLGIGQLDGAERLLIIFPTLLYLLGVQLPTFTRNVPLNNKLQTLETDTMDKTKQKAARQEFETRWNFWNSIRTPLASLTSALLMILLFRL